MKKLTSGVSVIVMGLASGAGQAATNHQLFQDALGAEVLNSISSNAWVSPCFIAENGLGTITTMTVSVEGDVDKSDTQYFDMACIRSANYVVTSSGNALSVDKNPNQLQLSGGLDGKLIRLPGVVDYERNGEVIHLYPAEGGK